MQSLNVAAFGRILAQTQPCSLAFLGGNRELARMTGMVRFYPAGAGCLVAVELMGLPTEGGELFPLMLKYKNGKKEALAHVPGVAGYGFGAFYVGLTQPEGLIGEGIALYAADGTIPLAEGLVVPVKRV